MIKGINSARLQHWQQDGWQPAGNDQAGWQPEGSGGGGPTMPKLARNRTFTIRRATNKMRVR